MKGNWFWMVCSICWSFIKFQTVCSAVRTFSELVTYLSVDQLQFGIHWLHFI